MLQHQWDIFNIVNDSFHVVQLIDKQMQNDLNPQDIDIAFNFVAFYIKI